jgi:hypothetical protein
VLVAAVALATALSASSPAASSLFIYGCASSKDPGGETGSICRIDPIGHHRRVLIPGRGRDFRVLSASADGARLAFSDISTALFSAFSGGKDMTTLVSADESPPHVLFAAMSPDGDRVAYVTFEDQPQERTPVLWTVGVDGSDRRRVGSSLIAPGWFGKQLIAVPVKGNAETGERICIIDEAQGLCRRAIAKLPGGELGGLYSRPAVSPDGRLVAAYSAAPQNELNGRFMSPGAYVYRTDTGKRVAPVDGSGLVTDGLAWSPDGRAIAFTEAGYLYVRRRPPARDGYVATTHATGVAWTGKAGSRAANLRITRATVTGRTLVVHGTLASRARRTLRAEFFPPSTGYADQIYTVAARKGRFAFKRRLDQDVMELGGRCSLTLAFPGDAHYGWAFARRRPHGRRACNA